MSPTPRQRVPVSEIEKVKAKLGDKADRLAWALAFAQENLKEASPGWWTDAQVTLAALTGAGGRSRGDQSEVLTREEIQEVQHQFTRYVREWVSIRKVTLGRSTLALGIELATGPGGEEEAALRFDFKLPKSYSPDRVAFELALLLVPNGSMVKVCEAPKAWGEAGEKCGRWFLGRPNRRYCSLTCQSRAGARIAREPHRRERIVPPPRPFSATRKRPA